MKNSPYPLIPTHYDLTFNPDLDLFVYSGREVITFELPTAQKEIWLDAVALEIISCTLLNSDSKDEICKTKVEDKKLFIIFPKRLAKGTYRIEIIFTGEITNNLAGWYKSRYMVDGQLKYVATSHFEPADARRVFPCVDHPLYKATFAVSFLLEKDLKGISNMPEIAAPHPNPLPGGEGIAGKKLVQFEATPVMSTYLLYLGVGEFEWIEGKYNDVLIRGITSPGKSEYAKFAIEETKKYLAYFEEYFGVQYPLPKVDLIGLTDFAAGAMEHWGAITFRENSLLFYPGRTSIVTKQRISETVAHELAHQWFGNLVTMQWWEDLWLNESFATFMANKAVDHFYPEWHVWTKYVEDVVFAGMSLDKLQSSHPIQVQVDDVEHVNELFDEIAYDKGGSILRMLEGYLGEESFQDGLQVYIKKFAYANAEGKDLWKSLETVAKKPVVKVMESFIQQVGFPEVKVAVGKGKLVLEQERFMIGDQTSDVRFQKSLWAVPIVWTDGQNEQRHLLEKRREEIVLQKQPEFVNANVGYAGFYVTEYADDLLEKLGKHLEKIGVEERLGVVHDFYYSVLSGRKTVAEFVDFIEQYYVDEKNPSVLSFIISQLFGLYLLLEKIPPAPFTKGGVVGKIQEVTGRLAEKALIQIGWEPIAGEDPEHVVLRNVSLSALGIFGHAETERFVLEKFEAFLVDEKKLHEDLRGTIYALAVWSREEHYETVLALYHKTHIEEEKTKFLRALARSQKTELLSRTLAFSLSSEVSFSNIIYIFASLSGNPYARELAIDWVIGNWEKLHTVGGGMADMILRYLLKFVIPRFGVGREAEVARFLGKMQGGSLAKTAQQVQEELAIHARLVERNKIV